jgi:ATP-dependent exoDNAse (exonuclease V) alpha subunit
MAYGLREHDRVIFAAQHRPLGEPRVENGALGQVTRVHRDTLTVTLDGSDRDIDLAGEELAQVRLAYAQHISKQQGATITHAFALTGGWQTSRETSYVQATRARDGCDWFIAREDLGEHGHDERRTDELAARMRESRSQTPSLTFSEHPEPRLDRELQLERDHPSRGPRLLEHHTHANPEHTRTPELNR